jgi:hypothetical protein
MLGLVHVVGREAAFHTRETDSEPETGSLVALLFGLAMGGFLSAAGAQTDVKEKDKDRDAAIEKCIARAHREYPDPAKSDVLFRARVASYKACMAETARLPSEEAGFGRRFCVARYLAPKLVRRHRRAASETRIRRYCRYCCTPPGGRDGSRGPHGTVCAPQDGTAAVATVKAGGRYGWR